MSWLSKLMWCTHFVSSVMLTFVAFVRMDVGKSLFTYGPQAWWPKILVNFLVTTCLATKSFWLPSFQCVALSFTLNNILHQKKNYGNSNISWCKNIIFKKIPLNKLLPNITILWLIPSFNTSQNIIFQKSLYKNRSTTWGPKFVKLLTIFYNESKHNILALVGNAKKKWKPKQKSTKWMPCKVCIKKFLWFYQIYENIYQRKLSMISPIIHNSKI